VRKEVAVDDRKRNAEKLLTRCSTEGYDRDWWAREEDGTDGMKSRDKYMGDRVFLRRVIDVAVQFEIFE